MRKIKSVTHIKDPYTKRILSNILHKDAFRIYARTPARLSALLNGLDRRRLEKQPAKGKWSIAQIVTHLSDSEVVTGFRYRMAIAQAGSPLQAYDQNAWAKRLRYDEADCRKKLELFAAMRHDNIALLRSLSGKEWKRYGVHAERGKETVERMVQMTAGHDVNHLRQVARIRKTLEKTER